MECETCPLTNGKAPPFGPYLALAAFAMAYGWGYRGTVGHEGGAMVPGALLRLALCLGSQREDWRGRSVVAHQWFLKNQYTWLRWYGKTAQHPERAEVPLEFRGQRMLIAWPPGESGKTFIVFERVSE